MGREDPQFRLRLPERLRSELEDSAAENDRSLTAEIVSRLERSLATWPPTDLPQPMIDRAMAATDHQRKSYEFALNAKAIEMFESYFPDVDDYQHAISVIIHEAVLNSQSEKRGEILHDVILYLDDMFSKLGLPKRKTAWPKDYDDTKSALDYADGIVRTKKGSRD